MAFIPIAAVPIPLIKASSCVRFADSSSSTQQAPSSIGMSQQKSTAGKRVHQGNLNGTQSGLSSPAPHKRLKQSGSEETIPGEAVQASKQTALNQPKHLSEGLESPIQAASSQNGASTPKVLQSSICVT